MVRSLWNLRSVKGVIMRKLLPVFLFCLFMSCQLDPAGTSPEIVTTPVNSKKDRWTILIYMSADNDLESEAMEDILEMEMSNVNTKYVNVLFLLDRHPGYDITSGNWTGTRLYKLKCGRKSNSKDIISTEISCDRLGLKVGTETELDMSSGYILSNAISFMLSEFKSDYYGLIMWGHGTGWRNTEKNSSEQNKAFAFDSTSGTYMSLNQMSSAIMDGCNGRKLDVIGFDTCFGGELEILYQLRNCGSFGIGTPGLLHSNGWNYKLLLDDFAEKKEKTPLSFCQSSIYQFQKQYAQKNNASIVAVNLEEINSYFDSFENFMEKASEKIINPSIRDEIMNGIYYEVLSYCQGKADSDVYLDSKSLVQVVCQKLELYGENLYDEKELFFATRNQTVVDSWAFNCEEASPGVYFATLAESGLYAAKHPSGYIKGSGFEQIDFVRDSSWYVPSREKANSFMDKMFYTTSW